MSRIRAMRVRWWQVVYLATCFSVRHRVYCEPHGGRPALMRHPDWRWRRGPHDRSDLNPRTIHVLVTVDGVPAGSMRLIPNSHQAVAFWDGWPDWTRGVREASRVALLPDYRSRPDILYALLGHCVEESIAEGCNTWVATMRAGMLSALYHLGIPVELLNEGKPVQYRPVPGVHMPASLEPLYMCVIHVGTDVPVALWAHHNPRLERDTGRTPFEHMFPRLARAGWRPSPEEMEALPGLQDGIREGLAGLRRHRVPD